jgi:hypothetical protein
LVGAAKLRREDSPRRRRASPEALLKAQLCCAIAASILQVKIHVELVWVRSESESVVFFLFQLNPVADEILREDIAFEQEIVVRFYGSNRAN